MGDKQSSSQRVLSPAARTSRKRDLDVDCIDDDAVDCAEDCADPTANLPKKRARSTSTNKQEGKQQRKQERKRETTSSKSLKPLFGFHLLKTTGIDCRGDAYIALDDIVTAGATLAIICNFKFDIEWMWQRAPALQTCQKLLIVHGGQPEEQLQWTHFLQTEGMTDRVRFYKPSLPAYGTMHSKLFLLFYPTGCRVCVQTANMLESDWDFKTQAAYVRDFPKSDSSPSPACEFLTDLSAYLSHSLPTDEYQLVLRHLQAHDFRSAGVALVTSVPGIHRGEDRWRFGHARLRTLLSREVITETASSSTAVCQFSSLGSIQEKWLRDEFATTLFCQAGDGRRPFGDIKLVYPTCEQVEQSNEGLQAGVSLPVHGKNLHRSHIIERLHRWNAQFCHRETAMPHIKTFLRYSNDSPEKLAWMFVGSFNLSVAAWGRMQGARGKKPWDRLNVLSFEVGVLFTRSLACKPVFGLPDAVVKYAVPCAEERLPAQQSFQSEAPSLRLYDFRPHNLQEAVSTDVFLPLPYKIPPPRYGRADSPWTVERCNMV